MYISLSSGIAAIRLREILRIFPILVLLFSSTAYSTDSVEAPVMKNVFADSTADAESSLDWMAGHWLSESGEDMSEELWLESRYGLMLGIHRTIRSGKPFFEFLRIEVRDSSVVYIAQPRGTKPTEFVLVETGKSSVIFENPELDFPRRIIYQRDNGQLTARIEGTVDGSDRRELWIWERTEN